MQQLWRQSVQNGVYYSFPSLHISYTDVCISCARAFCVAEGDTTFAQLRFVSLHWQQTERAVVSSGMGVCVIDGGAQKVCSHWCDGHGLTQPRSSGSPADGLGGSREVEPRSWDAKVIKGPS